MTQLYDSPRIHERMTQLERREPHRAPIIKVARAVVEAVWLQEAQHAEYLKCLKETILQHPITAAWNDVFGGVQARVMEMMLSLSPMVHRAGRIAATIGMGFAPSRPKFLADLQALLIRQFCLFIAEMEETAVDGYERMQTLTSEHYERHHIIPFNIGFAAEVGRILVDERNHRSLFRVMANWFTRANTVRRFISAEDCVKEVLAIVGAPLPLSEPHHDTVYAAPATATPELLFDGGFKQFFQTHGIQVQVANEATSYELVGDLFLRGTLLDPAAIVR